MAASSVVIGALSRETDEHSHSVSNYSNLDCLRAFAVCGVLIDHITRTLTNQHVTSLPLLIVGRSGVMAFFVHTSLVLMYSLERMPEQRRAWRFLVRRAFRIYPLAILCVVSVVSLHIPVITQDGDFYRISATIIISNILLIQNLIGKYSVCGPMWSLPFEVQMYAVLPLIFRITKMRKAAVWVLGMAAYFSCIGWMVQRLTGHANLLAYIPCFLGGILAYTLRRTRPTLSPLLWPITIAIWMEAARYGMASQPLIALPAGWLASLILGASIFLFRESTNQAWNKATAFAARYSYGIYLSHVPMIWLVFRVLKIHNNILATILWLATTLGSSIMLFHALESPMINLGKRLTRPRVRTDTSCDSRAIKSGVAQLIG